MRGTLGPQLLPGNLATAATVELPEGPPVADSLESLANSTLGGLALGGLALGDAELRNQEPALNPEVEVGPSQPTAAPATTSRLRDFVVLSKPRIAVMSLLVVAAGYAVGRTAGLNVAPFWPSLLGIGLVAVASSVLNQWLERETDGLMRRTERRPLPTGRITAGEALVYGGVCLALGLGVLLARVNLATAAWSLATCVLYVAVYTPLKRKIPLATTVGAIPGALPPVLGWLAAGRPADWGALALFAILFLWQFPHFLAIAWMYRDDYERAGLKMLPTSRPIPGVTGWMAVAYALALIPASLLPAGVGLAGGLYQVAALVLGVWYLAQSVAFARREDTASARKLLRVSLVYLPVLLAVLVYDHYRLLDWGR